MCPASEAAADGAARIGFVLLGPPIPKGRARTAAAFPVHDLADVQVGRFVGAGVQAEAAAVFHQSVGVQDQG